MGVAERLEALEMTIRAKRLRGRLDQGSDMAFPSFLEEKAFCGGRRNGARGGALTLKRRAALTF
jgi:hypothetical protein